MRVAKQTKKAAVAELKSEAKVVATVMLREKAAAAVQEEKENRQPLKVMNE